MLGGLAVTRASKAVAIPTRALVRGAKTTLRLGSRGRPVSLSTLLRLRRFGGRTNILTFRAASVVRSGSTLANPFLAERLGNRRFGDWTISAQAMNLLEREIRARPPRRVLEFGSGLSTACLSRYMAENASGAPRPCVVSVEEDGDFCTESRATLQELGLDGLASVHHAPLVKKEVASRTVNAYDLPAATLAELEAEPPGLVFIDGPGMAGGRFARWAVLYLVMPLLPEGFRFYLDDALSDSALECAQLWAEVPGVRIAGVSLAGHGVLVGEFRP
jgi:Methyltransferase domain